MNLAIVDFKSFEKSINEAFNDIAAYELIKKQSAILIKPNLITDLPHPITTSPECCKVIIEYIKKHSNAKIVIAEGCGEANLETGEVFKNLGFTAFAEKYGVSLIDLNYGATKILKNKNCPVFPEISLPEIAFNHYIISVPVLKAHSLAGMTGTLKNMMGFAQPAHYSGNSGVWKKAKFHESMQQSIIDLNKYLIPDLTIMDCSVGMADFHLGGAQCNPPVKKIIAGYNPWEIDREAAGQLGLNWKDIEHVATGFKTR